MKGVCARASRFPIECTELLIRSLKERKFQQGLNAVKLCIPRSRISQNVKTCIRACERKETYASVIGIQ